MNLNPKTWPTWVWVAAGLIVLVSLYIYLKSKSGGQQIAAAPQAANVPNTGSSGTDMSAFTDALNQQTQAILAAIAAGQPTPTPTPTPAPTPQLTMAQFNAAHASAFAGGALPSQSDWVMALQDFGNLGAVTTNALNGAFGFLNLAGIQPYVNPYAAGSKVDIATAYQNELQVINAFLAGKTSVDTSAFLTTPAPAATVPSVGKVVNTPLQPNQSTFTTQPTTLTVKKSA